MPGLWGGPAPFQETFSTPDYFAGKPAPLPKAVETVRRTRPELISGKFTLVKKVGAGGAGEVWKAWDESIHRWVALKFLKNEEEINLQLFRREARMVGRLNHPHIIPIHEMGVLGEHHYIAMKYVEGSTLREYVRRDARLLAGLIRDAARALHYAHENDVVHRDIKPTNFLVEEQESTAPGETSPRQTRTRPHLYVADFGLAKQVSVDSSISASGMLLGTPAYMSPEQARGKSELLDLRTDIYSLGATLYELLSGQPPFLGDSVYDLLQMIVDKEPDSIRTRHSEIDRDLETIVMKCLRKEPENRYTNAADLAEDLERYLDDEPLKHARPPAMGYLFRKRIQKQPLLWSLGAALVVLILSGVGFGAYTLADRQRIRQQGLEEAERERKRADMATLRAKSLLNARRAVEWGEGNAKVLSILRKAESETEPGAVWLTEAGRLLYETNDKGMHEQATSFLEEATRLDPTGAYEALYFLHLIKVYGGDDFWSDFLAELVSRAMQSREHDNVFVLIARSGMAMQNGNLEQAFQFADGAVKKGGNLSLTWGMRGTIRRKKGDLPGAISDFTRAVEIDPEDGAAFNSRGLAHFRKGDNDPAIQDFNRAIEIDPLPAIHWYNRGLARVEKEVLDGAIQDFTRAIEIHPEIPGAWFDRGRARALKQDLKNAITDFEEVVKLAPNHPRAADLRVEIKKMRQHLERQ